MSRRAAAVDDVGTMETRDKVFFLLVLGAGAYYGHKHWGQIKETLGVDGIQPAGVRAISLCKQEFTFDSSRRNGAVLEERLHKKQITVVGDLWMAERRTDWVYIVRCRFQEGDEACMQEFEVEMGSGKVTAAPMERERVQD